jgi:hypothetical protein
MRRSVRTLLVVLAAAGPLGCGPAVDLVAALRVDRLDTGWIDAGYADGVNKITPSLSVTLTNTSSSVLGPLHLNAVFRQAGHTTEWGARFVPVAGSSGLQPGKSANVVLTSDVGYTSFDLVNEMLVNSQFVDADVDLFARYGSSQWVRLAHYPVTRQLVQR